MADTPDPGGQKKQYPCDKCGTLRTESEGGTVFTVCDKCWDEKPVQPEQIHRNTDTMENEVARCAECNCELASFEVDGQSIAGCPVCRLHAELAALHADKQKLEEENKELREESAVVEQCAAHVEKTLGYVFPGFHSWLELVDAADVRIRKLEGELADEKDQTEWVSKQNCNDLKALASNLVEDWYRANVPMGSVLAVPVRDKLTSYIEQFAKGQLTERDEWCRHLDGLIADQKKQLTAAQERVSELEKVNAAWVAAVDPLSQPANEVTKAKALERVQAFRAEVEKLRAALKFYADANNWKDGPCPCGNPTCGGIPYTSLVHLDSGKQARAALEKEAP